MTGKIKKYIKTWEKRCYSDGIPDEVPVEIADMVPSYKRIAIAILKNDFPLKSLGFNPPVSEYYGILKRIEIKERNRKKGISTVPIWTQLTLNFTSDKYNKR